MALTDSQIKAAKPQDKPFKIKDGMGLYLVVKPNGKKRFHFRYRFDGKENTLSFGLYPLVTLKDAHNMRDDARKLLADGKDPSAHKKAEKKAEKDARAESIANSFGAIAEEWLDNKCKDKSPRPKRMLKYVLPSLGDKPIADIKPPDILKCLRVIEGRGTVYSAKKALQMYGQIFRYAVATTRAERDITRDLKEALSTTEVKHFAAITEPKQSGELLRAIDGYTGSFPAHCALKLAPLFFVRPGELRAAKWADVNLDNKEWRYFVTKTKVNHVVPLSVQAVEVLAELRLVTGHGVWLFPSERNPGNTEQGRCMSENTLNGALKRLGYGKDVMTAHGFRAMARTILDEVLGWRVDYIEHQLAHAVRDPNGRAYNRTAHLPERHKMMQAWADYLDNLKNEGNVIPLRGAK